MKRLLLLFMLTASLSSSVFGQFSGTVGGGLGATMPQGEFNEYTKTGFSIMGFGTINPLRLPHLGIRLALQGVFFEGDTRNVMLPGYPDDVLTETYSNDLIKGTIGLELAKRLDALEPYGSAGIGIYYFESKTVLRNEDDVEVASNKLDSKTRFGWNLSGGVRFFLFSKLAVDLNIQYDIVQNLEQYSGEEIVSFNSKFLSLFAGVAIPLGVF